jgi:hypothetical protein
MWLTIKRVSYGLKNVEVYWRKMLLGFVPSRSCFHNILYSFYILLVKGSGDVTALICLHRWADPSLSFPGSQLSCQIRVLFSLTKSSRY